MIKELRLPDLTFDFVSKAKYDFNTDCVVDGIVKNAFLYGKHNSGISDFVDMSYLSDVYYQIITSPNHSPDSVDCIIKKIINNKYKFLVIDNLDVHYEKLIEFCTALRESKTQSILITNNTFMMNNDFTRPDCIFIKEAFCNPKPLNELTDKDLRKAHNLEKLYRGNSFHYDNFQNGNGRK